jgi:hypothetical protein
VPTSFRGKLALAITLVAVVAFAGGAYAATQDSSAVGRQAFLSDAAKRLNVTPKQLESALQGAYYDQLRFAVSAGRLTPAQADAIRQRAQAYGVGPFVPLPRGG